VSAQEGRLRKIVKECCTPVESLTEPV